MKTNIFFTPVLILVIIGCLVLPCAAGTISIEKGWNFISIPVTNSDPGSFISQIAQNVDTGSHSIFKYNSVTAQWIIVNLNTPLSPQDGFWVYSTEKKEISVPGDNSIQYPYSTQLNKGWNAIGFAGSQYPASQAFSSLSNNWLHAFTWDGANQRYEPTIFNGDQSSNTPIIPGKGYWIYMSDPAVFYFPQSIPTTTLVTIVPTTVPTSIPGTSPFPFPLPIVTQPTIPITTIPTLIQHPPETFVPPTPTPSPTMFPLPTVTTFRPPTSTPISTPVPGPISTPPQHSFP